MDASAAGPRKQSSPSTESESDKSGFDKAVAEFVDEFYHPYKYSYQRTVEYVRDPNARLDQIRLLLAGDPLLPIRWEGYVDDSQQTNVDIPVRHSIFPSQRNEKAHLMLMPGNLHVEHFQLGQHVVFEGFFQDYSPQRYSPLSPLSGFIVERCTVHVDSSK
jgi:hypothetical protein